MARAHQNPPSNNTMNPRAEPASPLGGEPPPIAGAPLPPAHALGAKLDDSTYVQTISTAPIETFSPEQLQGADGQIRAQSRPRQDFNRGVPREPEPEVEKWVVTQAPEAPIGGATFRRGKIVDSINYDLNRLLSMGVIMERIPKGYQAADVLAGRIPAAALQPSA